MGFNTQRGSTRKSVLSAVKIALLSASLFSFGLSTAQAGTVNIPNNNPNHLSTLQVKDAVKKLYKGRIIYSKRTPKPGFPNCHVIKMITTTGEFKYIRYACTSS